MPVIIDRTNPPSSLDAEQGHYIEDEQVSYPLTFADDDNPTETTVVLGSKWDRVIGGEFLASFAAGSAFAHGKGVEGFSTPDDVRTPCIVFPNVAQSDSMHMTFELGPDSCEYMRDISVSLHVTWTPSSIDDSKTYQLEWEWAGPCGAIDLAATTTAPVCWGFTTAEFGKDAISNPCQVMDARMPACKITCNDGTLAQNPSGLSLNKTIELKVPKVPQGQQLGSAEPVL